MKDMTLIEWLIVSAIALLLVAIFVGASTNGKTFKATCDEAGGTTVNDGRQYQCIKK